MSNMIRSIVRANTVVAPSHRKGRHNPMGLAELNARAKKVSYLQAKQARGALRALPVTTFFRSKVRKPKETLRSYRRAMRNMNRALKMYFRQGPEAAVYIDRETLKIIW